MMARVVRTHVAEDDRKPESATAAPRGFSGSRTDRAFVESIIALCNELELDPSHLLNVVEDSLLRIGSGQRRERM